MDGGVLVFALVAGRIGSIDDGLHEGSYTSRGVHNGG